MLEMVTANVMHWDDEVKFKQRDSDTASFENWNYMVKKICDLSGFSVRRVLYNSR